MNAPPGGPPYYCHGKVIDEDDFPDNKQTARSMGAKYYYTGRPCKRGHLALRRTQNGDCVQCYTFRAHYKANHR